MKLNGSEIIVECLKEQNVDTIFGYPGGAILNVYDALYKHSDEITHILTSHEQGASPCSRRLCKSNGKGWRMFCNIRSGCDKPRNGNCHSIYGFDSGCCNYL